MKAVLHSLSSDNLSGDNNNNNSKDGDDYPPATLKAPVSTANSSEDDDDDSSTGIVKMQQRVLRVAVGSTNPVKIRAVEFALQRCLDNAALQVQYLLPSSLAAAAASSSLSLQKKQQQDDEQQQQQYVLDLQGFAIDVDASDVSAQPVGDAETVTGAKLRAKLAYRAYRHATGHLPHLAVGMEGGLEWMEWSNHTAATAPPSSLLSSSSPPRHTPNKAATTKAVMAESNSNIKSKIPATAPSLLAAARRDLSSSASISSSTIPTPTKKSDAIKRRNSAEGLRESNHRGESSYAKLTPPSPSSTPAAAAAETNNNNSDPSLHVMAWIAVYGKRDGHLVDAFANPQIASYVGDKRPVYGLAKTASFGLPTILVDHLMVMDRNDSNNNNNRNNIRMELGHADDAVFGREKSGQAGGTVGYLTSGLLDRAAYYEHAVLLAMIPWIRPDLYARGM